MEGSHDYTILVVEDDGIVRNAIKEILEIEYNVLEAFRYSGVLAFSENKIDIALIDYNLPDLDGFDVFKNLRVRKPALPAILMSGYTDEDLIIRALRAGFTDYMKKPLSFKYLKKRISEILGKPIHPALSRRLAIPAAKRTSLWTLLQNIWIRIIRKIIVWTKCQSWPGSANIDFAGNLREDSGNRMCPI